MLERSPLMLSGLPGDKAMKAAFEALLPETTGYTNPHLIFFGDSSRLYLIEEMLAKGTRPPATVHVIAQSAAWQTPEVRRIVELTNGLYREAKDPEELRQACLEICSYLQHYYTVRWKEESMPAGELNVYSDSAKGAAVYQS